MNGAEGDINNIDAIANWLLREAKSRQIPLLLHKELAKDERWLLTLPAYVENAADAGDLAFQLQELEDSWNNRKPRPLPMLLLTPLSVVKVNSIGDTSVADTPIVTTVESAT